MKKVVVGILAVIGVMAILAGVAAAVFVAAAALGKPAVPSRTVLQIDFEQGLVEAIPEDPLAKIMLEEQLTLIDVVDALGRAADDERVVALVARIGGSGIGLAHLQEVRDAVQRFRDSGKTAIAYAETFGEFGPGTGGYYLATAFDEIYMQPSGDIGLTGMMYESPFLRGTFDKLEMQPQMGQRYEYKNAMNVYTERSYTEPHRRAMAELLDSQFGQIVRGIALSRGKSEDEVRALIDRGPYLGREALDAGFVDGLKYEDEVYADLETQIDGEPRPLGVQAYVQRAGRPHTKGETVALIYGTGAVSRGSNRYSPLDGSAVMGSDSVVAAFRTAIDDERVKAIVFRVDSPGGSYVGSDSIWRETILAKQAGKPVIVSMGNLAGSGGYFVAMDAAKIVAQPGTITASIGVLGGKIVTRDLWNKLGITFDAVQAGENAEIFSVMHPYDEQEWSRIEAWLDRVYADFTQKVAEGRGMPLEEVQQIARGRIWTGEAALELGLVDQLGGLHEAFGLAREAIGLEPDAPIRVRRFPAEQTPFQMLFGEKDDHRDVARALTDVVLELQPRIRALQEIVGTRAPGLAMPSELAEVP